MRAGIGALALVLALLVSQAGQAQQTMQAQQGAMLQQSYAGSTGGNWLSNLFGGFGTSIVGNGPAYQTSGTGQIGSAVPDPSNSQQFLKHFGYRRPFFPK